MGAYHTSQSPSTSTKVSAQYVDSSLPLIPQFVQTFLVSSFFVFSGARSLACCQGGENIHKSVRGTRIEQTIPEQQAPQHHVNPLVLCSLSPTHPNNSNTNQSTSQPHQYHHKGSPTNWPRLLAPNAQQLPRRVLILFVLFTLSF